MKKVLGIVGSPRRHGNTHLLVEEALRGASESGTATETLYWEISKSGSVMAATAAGKESSARKRMTC